MKKVLNNNEIKKIKAMRLYYKRVLFHKEKRTTPQKKEAVILCIENYIRIKN